MKLAILTENLSSVLAYPADEKIIRKIYPDLTLGTDLNDASFVDWPRIVLIHPTPQPPANFGETVQEQPPAFSNGAWREVWTKQTITLAQAKQQLADLAVQIYWTKMQDTPSRQELQNAGRSYATVIQSREARFKPKLDDVATRIQNASTIAEAYQIYLELVALA